MKQDLYKLEGMQPGSEEYTALLNQMMEKLHHHNDDEEIDDLPLLEPAIGEAGSKEAALSFKKTKKFVPTRCATFPWYCIMTYLISNVSVFTELIRAHRTSHHSRLSLGSSLRPSIN